MKKILSIFAAVIMAVCMCAPLAACGNNTESPIKRIIGLDSEKTYVKGRFCLENNYELNYREMSFQILSYDKITQDEINEITFETSTNGYSAELVTDNFELTESHYSEEGGYFIYWLKLYITSHYISSDLYVHSINVKISGKDYKVSSDIHFEVHNLKVVYVAPMVFTETEGDPVKGAYSVIFKGKFGLTVKDIRFQTEGFEVISFYVEKYMKDEKISENLPVSMNADETYQIYLEATPPDDCLYYSCSLELVVQIGEYEIVYTNSDATFNNYTFKGSAISTDFDEEEYE